MSDQSRREISEAERDIDIALRARDVMKAMLSFYELRTEAEKVCFVEVLAKRVMILTVDHAG